MKRNDMIETIKKKAAFLKQFDEKAHLETYSGRFYNGKISYLDDIYLKIEDRILGEIKIIFDEIKVLEEYKPKNEKE
ncbi:MAG: hypothetical protein ABEI74_04780 [Candidatus Pacearchaeota archaeon]